MTDPETPAEHYRRTGEIPESLMFTEWATMPTPEQLEALEKFRPMIESGIVESFTSDAPDSGRPTYEEWNELRWRKQTKPPTSAGE